MRSTLLGCAAFAALFAIGSAQAADLPARPAPVYKAPAMVAPPTWTGCYIGAHVGGAWGTDNVSPVIPDGGAFPRTIKISPDGVLGGGTLGCNYQIQSFVIGIEGDGGYMDLNGSAFDPPNVTHSIKGGGYGDITGRLGFVAGSVLFYGKGGGAAYWGRETTTDSVPGFTPSSTSTFTGWTAGGGVEYMFAPNWTVKAEYLHFDFGTQNSTLTNGVGTVFPYSNRLTAETVKVGINYLFH